MQRRREIVLYAAKQRGYAVTINFGADFEKLLAHQVDPMRTVEKRVNAELGKMDLQHLPILLVLEAVKDSGRLHAHGVWLPDGVPAKNVHRALRYAVGYIESRAGSRQVCSKKISDADGWLGYISEDCSSTRRLLGIRSRDRLWWASHSITRRVRDEYESVRLGEIAAANVYAPMIK